MSLKKLPEYPTELKIIQKALPVLNLEFHVSVFGTEFHIALGTLLRTEYRVMDDDNNTYYIGNTSEECSNWVADNSAEHA